MTGKAQAFFRSREHSNRRESENSAYYIEFACPPDRARDLPWLVGEVRRLGAPKGSFQTGIFEIQTDEGIWSRADEMRLDFDTPRKAAKCLFKTWAELEAEELAQRGVAS